MSRFGQDFNLPVPDSLGRAGRSAKQKSLLGPVAKGGIDQTRFYLCHAAAWCVADSPLGPWVATAELPTALYPIPADSPSYAVTDVQAIEPSNDEIDRLRLQGSAIVARG